MPATTVTGNPEDIVSDVIGNIPLGSPLVRLAGSQNLYRIGTSSVNNCIDTELQEIVSVSTTEQVYHATVETLAGENVFTRVNPPVPTP